MEYLFEFLFGILTAVVGLLLPGMLNMNALKIHIYVSRNASLKFSFGAITVIFFQCVLGVFFATWLSSNEAVILLLKEIGIVIFFLLSIYFFYAAYKNKHPSGDEKPEKGGYFWRGIGMSSLNMLAMPFYVAAALYYKSKGLLNLGWLHTVIFSLGVVLGSFFVFLLYINFANFIKRRVHFITKNLNAIIGVIFLIIAGSTLFNLWEGQ